MKTVQYKSGTVMFKLLIFLSFCPFCVSFNSQLISASSLTSARQRHHITNIENIHLSNISIGLEVRRNHELHSEKITRPSYEHELTTNIRRRELIISSLTLIGLGSIPNASEAAFFGREKLQLELCLVTVLRVKLWAEKLSLGMSSPGAVKSYEMKDKKDLYMEARLGSKALLTGKIGDGANYKVFQLSSFRLRDCLGDGTTWFFEMQTTDKIQRGSSVRGGIEEIERDIIEALAACVEFDGLETTQDPSPRASLMLSMYNDQKAAYLRRLLDEKVARSCESYISQFSPDLRNRCMDFIRTNYANELPEPQVD